MEVSTLLRLFRSDVRDEAAPYLWSDEEILSYMDDAQNMFCRLQGGIADSSSAITVLRATAGDEFVSVSPKVLKIRSLVDMSSGRAVRILNFEDFEFHNTVDDYGVRTPYPLSTSRGDIKAVIVGMEANRLRLVNIPNNDHDLKMLVYRMPLGNISNGTSTLEIDEHHHRHLLLWMKHLAHQKQDAETYDRGRSDMFRAEFLAYCDQARGEREKREHKYRTIPYGGY